MGLFSTSDEDRVHQLFATQDVDEVVWRENVSNVAPEGATLVDVVVTTTPGAFLRTTRYVGLTYWPNGPVVRGVQTMVEGTPLVFKNVPVKPGGELALVADGGFLTDTLPAAVSVEAVGQGAGVAAKPPPGQLDINGPLYTFAALAAVLVVGYIILKAEA